MYRSPVDFYVDEWVFELLDTVERVDARRVLIDSLTDLQLAAGLPTSLWSGTSARAFFHLFPSELWGPIRAR
jgi:hypothetical protein